MYGAAAAITTPPISIQMQLLAASLNDARWPNPIKFLTKVIYLRFNFNIKVIVTVKCAFKSLKILIYLRDNLFLS